MATTRGVRKTSTPKPSRRENGGAVRSKDPLALEKDLMALAQAVPDSEWEKLPKDLNENLDHYLYGLPKRTSTKRVRI
jgi:hypothetical protein